ncbi:MAG: hypothetical protein FJ206_16975 [Gemmatimonadetes bacterium]|nr:hypothetical protein [Gemmatimonadota bacterium]
MTVAPLIHPGATELFSDFDQRWERWHAETYGRRDSASPLAGPATPATVAGLGREIEVKANLLADGIRLDPSVLEGIGRVYREQSRWLFDWNQGEHEYYLPEEILLPMDTLVQVRENKDSRWSCAVEDGAMVLRRDGSFVMECRQLLRPRYYGLEASPGVIMRRVAPTRGQDCLVWTSERRRLIRKPIQRPPTAPLRHYHSLHKPASLQGNADIGPAQLHPNQHEPL